MELEVRQGGAGMNNSNNQFRPLEMPKFSFWDRLTTPKWIRDSMVNQSRLFNKWADEEMKATQRKIENCKHENISGAYGLIICADCGKGMDEKPHYKWSWKLNKAVRL